MTNMTEPFIKIQDLHVWFPIVRGIFSRTIGYVKAVDNIDLTIHPRETLGLVGESGCGKTSLGRAIMGLEKIHTGKVLTLHIHKPDKWVDLARMNSTARRPYCRQIQMIFQDPFSSLNPRMIVRDIITEALVHHGLIEKSPEEDAIFWLHEVGLDTDAIHRYPHEFSGGQRQRICVARAIAMKPEFIVCDEAVSALDVSVQAQVINLLQDLSAKYDLSYLFITHDLSVVRHISDRIAVMYLGKIVELGNKADIIDNPMHPYTQALVSAVPIPGAEKKDRIILKGDVPSPANPPPGCPFHTRCPQVMDKCRTSVPDTYTQGDRQVCCHLHA